MNTVRKILLTVTKMDFHRTQQQKNVLKPMDPAKCHYFQHYYFLSLVETCKYCFGM
jgi:hypothetical protein